MNKLEENLIPNQYLNIMKKMIGYTYDNMEQQDIEDGIVYSMNKRYKEVPAKIENNYTKKVYEKTLLEISQYLEERKPIVTASGVIFQQHGQSPNPFAKLFKTFMDNREIDKAKMFSFPPGSDEYAMYDLKQLLDKLDANALKKAGRIAMFCS